MKPMDSVSLTLMPNLFSAAFTSGTRSPLMLIEFLPLWFCLALTMQTLNFLDYLQVRNLGTQVDLHPAHQLSQS